MNKKVIVILIATIILIFGVLSSYFIIHNVNSKKQTESTTKTKLISTTQEVNTTETTSTKVTTNSTQSKKTTSTTKKSTTTSKTTSKTTTTTTTKGSIVNTETVEENEVVEKKYGVTKTKISTYNIITYSNNTTEKKLIKTSYNYDYNSFNATTNEMKSEAITMVSKNQSVYNSVVSYVNEYREAAEAQPITLDKNLSIAATIRAIEMAYSDTLSHTRPNGTTCFTIFSDLGISSGWSSGENIAAGYNTAKAVTTGWYNSKGHRENMEKNDFNKIGVGMYELNGKKYWVQLFSATS